MTKLGEMFISNATDHTLLNTFGIVVSMYALYIEVKKAKDKNYVAICDISDRMSCSKVLTSKYGKGFGIVGLLVGNDHFLNMPNCILGIIFYILQLTLGYIVAPWSNTALFYLSVASCIGSLYLACILFFVLKDICLICITTYFINGGLLYLNYERFMKLDQMDQMDFM
ncbi:vitamin K epoxide reductase complex subunit 1-like protein 1 isoform X2 [Lineus longissimus]